MTIKLCECGCGQPAPIATQNRPDRGYVKGQPQRFIRGHATKGTKRPKSEVARRAETLTGRRVSAETRQKISRTLKQNGIRPSEEATRLSNLHRPTGEDSPSWKGGTTVTNGYRCIYAPEHHRSHPNGYVYEHVIVAERKLGRALLPGEVVHHINRDKLDNSPENLHVFPSQAAHIRHHQATDSDRD